MVTTNWDVLLGEICCEGQALRLYIVRAICITLHIAAARWRDAGDAISSLAWLMTALKLNFGHRISKLDELLHIGAREVAGSWHQLLRVIARDLNLKVDSLPGDARRIRWKLFCDFFEVIAVLGKPPHDWKKREVIRLYIDWISGCGQQLVRDSKVAWNLNDGWANDDMISFILDFYLDSWKSRERIFSN